MRSRRLLHDLNITSSLALLVACGGATAPSPTKAPVNPKQAADIVAPPAARVEVVEEDLFGHRLRDPYRWMEKKDNPELRDWMLAQGAFTRATLDRAPGRAEMVQRLSELSLESSSYSDITRAGELTFFRYSAPGAPQPTLMVRSADGGDRLLRDPAAMSHGTQHASIDNFAPSHDGRLVAINVATGGGEVTEIRVVDTATGMRLADTIERVWGEFPAYWAPDHEGFYYTQLAEPGAYEDQLLGMRLRFHKLGTDPTEDPVVLGPGVSDSMPVEPFEFPLAVFSPGSDWAIALATGARRHSRFYVARTDEISGANTPWRKVAALEDLVEDIAVHGDDAYLLSSKGSSNRQVLRVSLEKPDLGRATVVLPESEIVWTSISSARDALYLRGMRDGIVDIYRLAWGARTPVRVELPFVGTASIAQTELDRDGIVLSATGWTVPTTYFEYRPGKALRKLNFSTTSPATFEDVLVERVEVRSTDGTLVPMTVLRRRDTKLDGANPTILTGYGGYGSSTTPWFSPPLQAWLEQGGIYAVAHVRGGGEKGAGWHRAGQGANKPQGIRDFVVCAEYLADKGYASANRIAAIGGSMGGILVGRAITESPEAFGAAIIIVGMLNAVRYLESDNGANQTVEMTATPDSAEGGRVLLAMDAYHNIKDDVAYPPTLLAVGLNDGRVPPWETAKFGARLQAAEGNPGPVLLRVSAEEGHGVGSTRNQAIERRADIYTFALWQLGRDTSQQ